MTEAPIISTVSLVEFRQAGLPETKGSWRSVGGGKDRGPRRLIPDNPRSAAWESTIAWRARSAAQQRMVRAKVNGLEVEALPTSRRVGVSLVFTLPIPPNKGKKHRRDIDKLARAVLDALTGIVYVDDEQVVELDIGKITDAKTTEWGVSVRVYALADEPAEQDDGA